MKKYLVFTLTTALVLLVTAQLSIMALNNKSSGERTVQMGRYLLTQRWAYDQDPPPGQPAVLNSHARTSVFTAQEELDDNGDVVHQSELGWTAYASASYNGNNPNFQSSYHVKVHILDFKREDKDDLVGPMNASELLYVYIMPIPDNTAANIDDCKANGKADGLDVTNNVRYSTESNI